MKLHPGGERCPAPPFARRARRNKTLTCGRPSRAHHLRSLPPQETAGFWKSSLTTSQISRSSTRPTGGRRAAGGNSRLANQNCPGQWRGHAGDGRCSPCVVHGDLGWDVLSMVLDPWLSESYAQALFERGSPRGGCQRVGIETREHLDSGAMMSSDCPGQRPPSGGMDWSVGEGAQMLA
ncbi:hypothetical protein AAFF_G00111420 [Aldrovandia affinis]|uniref:Uncharacterized protein n=1 Tax=Aldrovandia affinis TaxID=143900 RepID=A0AAD7R114_9TELE|nr:hypothetical protein AAFF_G00111420 [Aldrovandia affinis]